MYVLMLSVISEEKLRRRGGEGINFPSLKRESLFEVGGGGRGLLEDLWWLTKGSSTVCYVL